MGMQRRFVSIKPMDQMGENPDRPSDEVLWETLQNVWFDEGVLKKRPAMVTAAHTSVGGTESPAHVIVEYRHPIAVTGDQTIRPTGVGSNSEWTPSQVSDNWTRVKEISPDTSTFVTSYTTLEKDSYAFGDTTLAYSDKITLTIYARRHTYGDYTITFFCRNAGTDEEDIGEDM